MKKLFSLIALFYGFFSHQVFAAEYDFYDWYMGSQFNVRMYFSSPFDACNTFQNEVNSMIGDINGMWTLDPVNVVLIDSIFMTLHIKLA